MSGNIKRPKICIPLVASNLDDLIIEAEKIMAMRPDLVEWRVDYYTSKLEQAHFTHHEVASIVLNALEQLYGVLSVANIPILFTIRSIKEGGLCKYDESFRMQIMQEAIVTGKIALVDIELDVSSAQDRDFEKRDVIDLLQQTIDLAHTNTVSVILSNHDFNKTPPLDEIIANIKRVQRWNVDFVKLAYLCETGEDVMSLLGACQYGRGVLNQKMIVITMGEVGKIGRITAGEFGSEIVFAVGLSPTAPGQLTVVEYLEAWESALTDAVI